MYIFNIAEFWEPIHLIRWKWRMILRHTASWAEIVPFSEWACRVFFMFLLFQDLYPSIKNLSLKGSHKNMRQLQLREINCKKQMADSSTLLVCTSLIRLNNLKSRLRILMIYTRHPPQIKIWFTINLSLLTLPVAIRSTKSIPWNWGGSLCGHFSEKERNLGGICCKTLTHPFCKNAVSEEVFWFWTV